MNKVYATNMAKAWFSVGDYNKAQEIAEERGVTPAEILNEFEEMYAEWMRDERELDEEF